MKEAVEAVSNADKIVVLTGAGMSVESGVAPFRGDDGLWNEYDPQEMASITAFERNSERCWELFKLQIKECFEADPHEGHKALVDLENFGLNSIITQNIDALHQEAGSTEVLEIHGTLDELVCPSCGRSEETEERYEEILDGEIPRCECGSIMRPNVVLFGEPLPEGVMKKARERTENCDLMMSIGTSAVVQPAASIPLMAKRSGAEVLEINIESTSLTDNITDYFLQGKAGEVLKEIRDALRE
ncbi:MAG: NAD-dependent deacylase [Candidatus Thermoplasmatota archaeon]|nr:NAD-dependent deacylase [Candidatus Thermoplasmatota archaeon]